VEYADHRAFTLVRWVVRYAVSPERNKNTVEELNVMCCAPCGESRAVEAVRLAEAMASVVGTVRRRK
jgi:hypothetical protein